VPRPARRVGVADVRRVARRVHAFQIDPINVFARAQYMPAFSRLGPYSTATIDTLTYERGELFEYFGHQASLLPTALYPLFRWRMDASARSRYRLRTVDTQFVDTVLEQVATRGPIAASDLADRGRRGTYGVGGWSWNDGKHAMAGLLGAGQIAVAGRRGMEQLYDLTERVIPRDVLDTPAPDPHDAKLELVSLAARAMGVATARDLEDYFGIGGHYDRRADPDVTRVRVLVADLVDAGRLTPVRVEGWRDTAYLDPSARVPSAVDAHALLSPFDSLIWERSRTRRVFGFDYRVEIYIPAVNRVHGYYVLPFLLGDRLVARVDVKVDRGNGALLVPAAFSEPGVDRKAVAEALASEARTAAAWLALDSVQVGERGDLAKTLATALRRASR
jgi:uncharacterized protein YcaQ